jgi:hypothetical protein
MSSDLRSKNKKSITPDFFHINVGETLISGLHNDTNIGYRFWTVAVKKNFFAVKPHILKLDFVVFEHFLSYFCTKSLDFGYTSGKMWFSGICGKGSVHKLRKTEIF